MDEGITIKIAGQAGQGIQTIGAALCNIFKRSGLHIFASQDYMSRIRGGNNFFQLRVSGKPISTLRQKSDITAALDKESVQLHRNDVASGGIIVFDKAKFNFSGQDNLLFDVPFYSLANAIGESDIFINSVCCGAVAGLARINPDYLELVIRDLFAEKDEEIISKNVKAAQAGYNFARDNFKDDKFKVAPAPAGKNLLMNGNDAIALGAIRAGCKFYSAYPMSPSTGIMNVVAHYANRFNIIVEQAEDEIAAINMVIGASFAGARSMTATSGGGLALMVEGLSLAAMTETPVVVVDAQRPAPATGFPTRTEQADLNFLIHAGHGEFAKVIYAPGTIQEAFYLTVKAFNIAEKYQIPVLIMTDQHLADSLQDIEGFDLNKAGVRRFIISKEDSKKISGYKRYQLTDSGISPRAIPSWIEDVIYADSDEHNEEGHITEEAQMRIQMVKKRFYRKMAGLAQETEKPTVYNAEKAQTLLLGFGSTYGVLKETCEVLGKDFGFVHLSQVWPFPSLELSPLLKNKKNVLTVENNAGSQLAGLLMRETGIKANRSILRYDGRPFNPDYLIEQIKAEQIK
ncbi:MAG: 2-oxoacid:acceptor oxidoreductase subunit alpha [Candidatus Omnitrophica bacterium]|nr:2-oxoacid:acceptor oxidoreductase subunit alpha [Candidatus Omnitrophota bacterium]